MSKTDQADQTQQKMFLVFKTHFLDRICWSPNKHTLNPGPIARRTCQLSKTCLSSVPICSLKHSISSPIRLLLCSVRDNKSHPSNGWMGWMLLKETKNQSWPLPLSTPVFSWVEEAADVGKQGCNTQHGDANDVGVGTHVAKRALTAASRLHLHGRCAQRLLQRSASCSSGSGAHEAEHRRAGQGQEHASEHTRAGASHIVSFGTKRAAQERPSKSSSSSQKHCGVRRTLTTMNIPSNEQN